MSTAYALLSHEATRSAAMGPDEPLLWDYTFKFHTEGDLTFAVTFNEQETVTCAMTTREIEGVLRVDVEPSSGTPPRASIDEDHPSLRTIVFEGLPLFAVQCARASIEHSSFPSPAYPSLGIEEPVTLAGGPAPIARHLASFFETLFAASAGGSWPIRIECRYVSMMGGLPVAAPVVLVPRQDHSLGDVTLFEQMASSIEQWRNAIQPPTDGARLSFAITVWSTLADTTLLKMDDVSLPMDAVTTTTAVSS